MTTTPADEAGEAEFESINYVLGQQAEAERASARAELLDVGSPERLDALLVALLAANLATVEALIKISGQLE